MTEEEKLGEKQPEKETIKRFVLRMTAPFRLETNGLGLVVSRALTASASTTFAKRLASLHGVADAELVRTYMGCVSGLPVEDEEALPDPLTKEQVALLTDDDVLHFAGQYLRNIVRPEEIAGDVFAQMAEFIRDERQKNLEAMKKMAETVRSALNIDATANYMKHWQALTKNVAGPLENLRNEAQRLMGPLGMAKSSLLGGALRAQAEDRERMLKAIRGFDNEGGLLGSGSGEFKTLRPERISMPTFPPVHETPVGRTAIAVEKLGEASDRMEEAMGLVLEQAGNVSGMVSQVLTKIEIEAAKSQGAARNAFWVGATSLVVAALALMVSAYFSVAGYQADREDAKSSDRASAVMTKRVEEQTAAIAQRTVQQTAAISRRMDEQSVTMRELLEETRKSATAKIPTGSVKATATPKTDAK